MSNLKSLSIIPTSYTMIKSFLLGINASFVIFSPFCLSQWKRKRSNATKRIYYDAIDKSSLEQWGSEVYNTLMSFAFWWVVEREGGRKEGKKVD